MFIVGGGISGLSAAWYLNKAGIRATLVEQSTRVGGVIQTEHVQGSTLEAGPDSFLAIKPAALELIRDAGLADLVIGSNDHSRTTFIQKRGRLEPLPDGMMMMVPTKIMPMVRSRLLGWGTKIRMGLEYFRRPAKGSVEHQDRSVRDFLRDHYGRETVDYIAEPLLAGIYGGDPAQLSANCVLTRFVELEKKYGSLTRGVLAERRPSSGGPLFRTLRGGLSTLIDALEDGMDRVRGTADALERTADGWRVRVNGEWTHAGTVLLAVRAYQAASLLAPHEPELASRLNAIPYTSSLTLSIGFNRAGIKHPLNGHGFLVPKLERKHVKACTWVHRKFDYRVPENQVVMRCFMSGDSLDQSDDVLLKIARAELRDIMGVELEPIFHTIHRWPRSMAQYTVGHQKRIEEVRSRAGALPGLYLAGNYFDGIGIPDCIRLGKAAAEAIAAPR